MKHVGVLRLTVGAVTIFELVLLAFMYQANTKNTVYGGAVTKFYCKYLITK